MSIPVRSQPTEVARRRAPVPPRPLLGGLLALTLLTGACTASSDEVGGSPRRPSQNGGQGGVGDLPGASGQGGAAAGAAGGTTTGSGGSATGFTLRAGGLGRGPDLGGDEPGPKIRLGGISPLGRVCSPQFCVTGDLR